MDLLFSSTVWTLAMGFGFGLLFADLVRWAIRTLAAAIGSGKSAP